MLEKPQKSGLNVSHDMDTAVVRKQVVTGEVSHDRSRAMGDKSPARNTKNDHLQISRLTY